MDTSGRSLVLQALPWVALGLVSIIAFGRLGANGHRSAEPVVPAADLERERDALEAAGRRIEALAAELARERERAGALEQALARAEERADHAAALRAVAEERLAIRRAAGAGDDERTPGGG